MTIGAVLAALQQDFPDVTISKIRFLEAEGLVTPARTGSGYRTYAVQDLDRLRYILTAQRDHFWPLKVIAAALDAMDRGLTPERAESGMPRPSVPTPVADPEVPTAAALTAAGVAAAHPRRAGDLRRGWTPTPSTPWRTSACCTPTPPGTSATRRSRWRTRLPSSRHTDSNPATCGRSAPRPTARSGWSSRS